MSEKKVFVDQEDVFKEIVWLHDNGKISNQCRTNMTERLYKVPAAPVAPVVRGEWKLVYKEAPALFECTACGNRELYADSECDFCPSCGAVMTDEGMKKVIERS